MNIIRFSTLDYPEKQRRSALEEQYSAFAGMELWGAGEATNVKLQGRILPGAGIVEINTSPHLARRTTPCIADGNDDLALFVPVAGRGAITHKRRKREVFAAGEVYLAPNDIPFDFVNHKDCCILAAYLPRHLLEPKLARPDAVLMKKSRPSAQSELRLITQYIRTIITGDRDISPATAHLSSVYIQDLAALLLSSDRDTTEQAKNRGLRALRFQAVKQFIADNCHRADLTLEMVAAQNNISPHYVRKLFYDAETSFSDYLLDARLSNIHRQLRDLLCSRKSIGELVFDAGFNNLSWFNRAFKRRYGMTPSDMRAI